MRSRILLLLIAVVIILTQVDAIHGRERFLPKWETDEEKEGRKIQRTIPDDIERGDIWGYPSDGVRVPAEYEASQGFMVSWSLYDWYTTPIFIEILQSYSNDNYAYIVVMNENERDDIRSRIIENDIAMSNIKFLMIETNSCWIRDYAPIFVYDDRDTIAAIDMLYYADREEDDNFPAEFCRYYSIPFYEMGIFLEGGNFMTDGEGLIITTEALYDVNSFIPREEIDEAFARYFGANRVVALRALQNDPTAHVDMFAKIIDRETIMLAMPIDSANADFSRMQFNISILESLSLSSGDGVFEIVELPLHIQERAWPPGWNYYTYTNSLIIGEQVFVPQYDHSLDDSSVSIYQTAMPEKEIIPIDCSAIINAGGAVHCLAMQIPEARPLKVESENSICKPEMLGSVYPNPFNSTVRIEIAADCPYSGPYDIDIYNLIGVNVRHFGNISSGSSILWDGRNKNGRILPSGVYLIVGTDGQNVEYRKVIYSR